METKEKNYSYPVRLNKEIGPRDSTNLPAFWELQEVEQCCVQLWRMRAEPEVITNFVDNHIEEYLGRKGPIF